MSQNRKKKPPKPPAKNMSKVQTLFEDDFYCVKY